MVLPSTSLGRPDAGDGSVPGYTIDYGALMMSVLFCSLPTIIIFFILQKQFAEGITGAVK